MRTYAIVDAEGLYLGTLYHYPTHYAIGHRVLGYYDYMCELMGWLCECVGDKEARIKDFKGFESFGWDEALEMDEEHEEWEA